MIHRLGVKYMGLALPLTATTVNLFSTVKAFPHAGSLQSLGLARFFLDLVCDHDGTLTYYKDNAAGLARSTNASDQTSTTGWVTLGTTAVTGGSTPTELDFMIEAYSDWKLDFLVGASTETVFAPSMVLTSERVKAS
jgi:hypothetical protein